MLRSSADRKPRWSRILNSPPSPPGSWGAGRPTHLPSKSAPRSLPSDRGADNSGATLFPHFRHRAETPTVGQDNGFGSYGASNAASVLARTSSRVTPGASSVRRHACRAPSSKTPRSVISRSTHAGAGQRQGAALQQLRRAGLLGVLHHHHDALDAGHQVHGPAHALDHLAGHHPVGEVAVLATPACRPGSTGRCGRRGSSRSCRRRRNSDDVGSSVMVCLPALIRSGSASPS